MKKILITEKLSEEGIKILKDTPGFIVDVRDDLTPEKLKEVIGLYDAVIIRSNTKMTKDIIGNWNE